MAALEDEAPSYEVGKQEPRVGPKADQPVQKVDLTRGPG